VNLGHDTALADRRSNQLVQLIVLLDRELDVAWRNATLFVISSIISRQFQYFRDDVFHDGGDVNSRGGTHAGITRDFGLKLPVNPPHGEEQSRFRTPRPRTRFHLLLHIALVLLRYLPIFTFLLLFLLLLTLVLMFVLFFLLLQQFLLTLFIFFQLLIFLLVVLPVFEFPIFILRVLHPLLGKSFKILEWWLTDFSWGPRPAVGGVSISHGVVNLSNSICVCF